MLNKKQLVYGPSGGALALCALLLGFLGNPDKITNRNRDQLRLREDGVLIVKETQKIFDGLLVDYHANGAQRSAVEILAGRAHGVSRGWHESGQIAVEESFNCGISHGLRRRWYPNGQKKSEALVVNGQLMGSFVQWHDNGERAAEASMVDGQADGVSLAWHRTGSLKARVELSNGNVVDQEFFNE